MPSPHELIKKVQEKILHFEASQLSLSETETRRALIDPIFAAIGWDTGNPLAVRMEWRKDPSDRPVDYAFMINGVPKLLVEAERLREDITDKKWRDQLLLYSTQAGVRWCALTNGNVIRIYNSLAEEAAADKLLFEIEVRTIDTLAGISIGAFASKLSLLSEESLRKGKIDEVWDNIYTKRKVFDYLENRKENLIDDIVKNARLTKKSVGEVLDRIIDLRDSFLEEGPDGSTDEGEVIRDAPPDYEVLFESSGKPINPTSRKISSFWFSGVVYEVGSWRDLLMKLCNIIRTEHKGEFEKVLELRGRKRLYYSRDENQLKHPKRIANTDIFAETNLSSLNTAVVCGHLLDKFAYERDIRVKIMED